MYKQEICTFKIIPIKCSKIKISYLHQLINKLSKLPFCSYFPPLPLDVTNLKKLPERKDSFLYLVQTDTIQQCTVHFPHLYTQNSSALYIFHTFIHKTAVHCTFSTPLYTKPQQNASIFRPRRKETKNPSTVVQDRKYGPEFWLRNVTFLPECLSQRVNGNSAVCVAVKSFAKCTLHSCSRLHVQQLQNRQVVVCVVIITKLVTFGGRGQQ